MPRWTIAGIIFLLCGIVVSSGCSGETHTRQPTTLRSGGSPEWPRSGATRPAGLNRDAQVNTPSDAPAAAKPAHTQTSERTPEREKVMRDALATIMKRRKQGGEDVLDEPLIPPAPQDPVKPQEGVMAVQAPTDASTALQRYLQENPQDDDAWRKLAVMHVMEGRNLEARRILDSVGEGDNKFLQLVSGHLSQSLGENRRAINEIEDYLGWLQRAQPLVIDYVKFSHQTSMATEMKWIDLALLPPGTVVVLYVQASSWTPGPNGTTEGLEATLRLKDPNGTDITPTKRSGWVKNDYAVLQPSLKGAAYFRWRLVWPGNLAAGNHTLEVLVRDRKGKEKKETLTVPVRAR